jgi:hypothetical protein
MLETHFGTGSALVWSSPMTFGCCAAHSAAPYGDASGADFRPSDVDYEGLPSLIEMIEGSSRSGSLRSFDCRIVIGRNHSVITRNRPVITCLPFLFDLPFHAGCRPGPPVLTQSAESPLARGKYRLTITYTADNHSNEVLREERLGFSIV